MCAFHWPRLTIRGASPSGCRLARSTFSGGASRSSGSPAISSAGGPVVGDERPAAVDGDRRVGLVAVEHELDRLVDGLHLGLVERALLVDRRVAGGEQEPVALAQRHLELVGEVEDHLGARLRAAGLDEAEVAGGDAGLEREVELAEAAALAPVAQQGAERGAAVDMGRAYASAARRGHYPAGNGSAHAAVTVTAMTDTTLTAPRPRPPHHPLRAVLDAVVSGANGVAYLVAAGPLGDLLGLPADLAARPRRVLRRLRARRRSSAAGPSSRRGGARSSPATPCGWSPASCSRSPAGTTRPRPAPSGSSCRRSSSPASPSCR